MQGGASLSNPHRPAHVSQLSQPEEVAEMLFNQHLPHTAQKLILFNILVP